MRKDWRTYYWVWKNMMSRCYDNQNKRYPDYGGRGIRVHLSWHTFEKFVEGVGPRPPGYTLDRINGNGDYEPGNVRWATVTEQNRNLRSNKLTEEQVAYIKFLRERGWLCRNIAALFGVSRQHINNIVNGKAWL